MEANIKALMIGDSHSNSIITAAATSIEKIGGGVLFLGADGCHSTVDMSNEYFNQCGEYNQKIKDKIKNTEALHDLPIIIVNRTSKLLSNKNQDGNSINGIKAGETIYIKTLKEDYLMGICELTKTNPVYILKPIPVMPFNVPEYLAKNKLLNVGVNHINLPLKEYIEKHQDTLNFFEEVSNECGAKLLDPTKYFCNGSTCLSTFENRPLYFDDNHISEFGNKLLVPMFDSIWLSEK
jgi:hypothetical protein